jgi:mRNA interferase RelE/StbE
VRSIGCRTRSYRLSRPVRFEFRGWCVARRGDYRATLRALEDDRVLYIGRVEHRAHVYRRQ